MQENHPLRQVQKMTLELLRVFTDFCRKHALRYYVSGGALLGLKRHGGFIPWDDDIDIVMPRADYERLLELLKTQMPDGYGLCNRHTDPDWHFALSQFTDELTEIEIDLAQTPRKAHIWLDIFPVDGLPDGKFARWWQVKYVLLHRYLVQMAHVSTQVDAHRKRPLAERLVLGLCRVIPLGRLINSDKVLDHMERVLRKYDFDSSRYAANLLGRYREREVMPQRYFGTPTPAVFGGVEICVPELSHETLTHLYGDYMQLPPEDERVAHNVRILKSRD